MWLFLPTGHYSVVVHRDDPSRVIVRSRESKPLEAVRAVALCGGFRVPEIERNDAADYRYRVTVSRDLWALFVAQAVADMRASNFKAEAERVRGRDAYTRALHTIWGVLFDALGRGAS
jgi:hypothetical protein